MTAADPIPEVREDAGAEVSVGAAGWRPIETADKGNYADMVTDPDWREPPEILLLFEGGERRVGKWDWYYAEGGAGAHESKGHGWVEPTSGELLVMYYDPPTHWQSLPSPPSPKQDQEWSMSASNRFASQERAALRVDFDEDGRSIDDIAIGGDHIHMVRLEDMGDGVFWGRITLNDGRALALRFGAERKGVLSATAEWDAV